MITPQPKIEPDAGKGEAKIADGWWWVKFTPIPFREPRIEPARFRSGIFTLIGQINSFDIESCDNNFSSFDFIAPIPTPEQMKARDEAMLNLLKSFEWCSVYLDFPMCPSCKAVRNFPDAKHGSDCKLIAALSALAPSATEATK